MKGIHQCDNRIVSIFQPHVRPIVRGKAKAKVEFGGKIGASIVDGYTFIDHHSWEAYNECEDLMTHLRCYKRRFGCLPEKFDGDTIYMNRTNRRILRFLRIEIGGKPLGRPSKEQLTEEYRTAMAKNIGERNEIEATFGTGKRVYKANDIRAKLPDTGKSWTAACYFAKKCDEVLKRAYSCLV
jgi:IS5 family transposase